MSNPNYSILDASKEIKCGKEIDTIYEEDGTYIPAYQVRMGHFLYTRLYEGFLCEDFEPDEDVGYFCSECLSKGV